MKKRKLIKLFVLLLSACSLAFYKGNPISENSAPYLPKISRKDVVLPHAGYILSYNEKHEQANWVAYVLTKNETQAVVKRNNHFIVDPLVETGSANEEDYRNSGYDRGHLAPAADMCWSKKTMEESFYYSNMSPQVPAFNRGIWKNCEAQVREWAKLYDSVYIVTGPLLNKKMPFIGPNHVSVPLCFFKVVLQPNTGKEKALGFLIPNKASSAPPKQFVVSVDSVEKLTGIDFFPQLNKSQEKNIEHSADTNLWIWNIHQKNQETKNNVSNAVICKGITKNGTSCKNPTDNPNGFCYLHQAQANTGN
jgi:endonuclease G